MAGVTELAESPLIDRLRSDELECIVSEVEKGRRDNILKALDERGRAQELVRQQYSGRYPFELLQNANDAAADTNRPGRVRFVLTDAAVIAADNGAGFGEEQIRAICGLGRSSKDPRKSVGYKGLGFKSVGEITNRPQIISDGVAFEFDDQRVRDTVIAAAGSLDPRQRLPVYAFPFSVNEAEIGSDAAVVRDARADGFTTILRLPLRAGLPREEVEQHLVETLLPRLLLFLTAVDEIEVAGTSADFRAVASRESHALHDEVLVETNGSLAHWLVYRKWIDTDRALVEPLGDAWAEVERVQVAIAVPLDATGLPTKETLFPLHVYFPTEESTGLPVVIHGDFALQIDRRQLATSPETTPYNETLIGAVAEFLAGTVAPDLAERFPGTAASAAAVTPRAPATGLGERFIQRCIEGLRGSRFLPGTDGALRVPAEALLLPDGVPDAEAAHHQLDLTGNDRILVAAVETDLTVRAFVRDQLEVAEWPLPEALTHLRRPSDDAISEYYEFLVDWSEGVGSRRFAAALASVSCVHTAAGEWVAPDEKVFFPRQRDDVDIPADLPVPIVQVPTIEGLNALLAEAGVRDFEWRELMRDYLLPILTSRETGPELRERAMPGLRAYYKSQRAGDPALQRRIGDVLLRASSATGTTTSLEPANSIYFSRSWTGSDALEILYGPFGEVEFLADDPPVDSDLRSAENEFLSWVGVAAHPRVLEAHTDQRHVFMTGNLTRHPHRSLGEHWQRWWDDPAVQAASHCEQGHSSSQQLRRSFALDRFIDLVQEGDSARMLILWNELAHNWGAVYEPATRAIFHCQNTSHGGERDRSAPSLFWNMLTELAWIPAGSENEVVFVRPRDAWRLAFDTPKWIANRVPRLHPRMSDGPGVGLAAILQVTDAARPSPFDLVGLLEELQREHEDGDEVAAGVHNAARWAMRTLNDVLATDPDIELGDVPLLARYEGEEVFTTEPVVALDPLLADTWKNHYPILDADRDLRRLHEALNLVVLDDPETGARVTPIPQGVDHDAQANVEHALAKAKPYLGALAVANTPSREGDVVRGLKRLEVVACSTLVLRYSFRGTTIDREEATTFIAVRQEQVRGAVRRNIGTAHLEISSAEAHPDWYTFGPQLAEFLQVPTLGDAFAVLLTGADEDRRQYLASRRIPVEAVESMRTALDLPVEDELSDDLFDFLDDVEASTESETVDTESAESSQEETVEASEEEQRRADESEPLPDLDPTGITISDVDPGEVEGRDDRGGDGGAGGLGPAGPVDHETSDRHKRELGRRGEQAAFEKERQRVQAFGGDPSAVLWRSDRNPYAPHDIESIDEDGQRIFIEVKSTTESDPTGRFPISQPELIQALRHRSRFYIYRVTSVDTATPAVHRYRDPARLLTEGKADLRLSDASMMLGQEEP
jgi:hypothetical protein